ncbi:MAG: phosphate transport system substrate-binding protein [Crocinitomix sp.]|jgi:phosphate transport system substrate-binding protein
MKLLKSTLVLALFFSFVGCQKSRSINISGSTAVLPIVSIAAEEFVSSNSELNIIVNGEVLVWA